MNIPSEIEFNRPRKYKLVRVLGSGACGETILVRDEGMAQDFVVKKYKPIIRREDNPEFYGELLDRFRDEARLLFRLSHPNIVRVYSFFDYTEHGTSYILMEFIDGIEVLDYLRTNPSNANRVFEGAIAAFSHLEEKGILHRDIRPANIIVDTSGTARVIDFGFGKAISPDTITTNTKSISLNWWCDTPPEFEQGKYDFQTEVYFLGKLFELAIKTCGLSDFKYMRLVSDMCEKNRASRPLAFSEIQRRIVEGKFTELTFSDGEKDKYRAFANQLCGAIASIEAGSKIVRDPLAILIKLEEMYRSTMLEEVVPSPNAVARIFISGNFRYWKNADLLVETLRNFIGILKGLSEEKRNIVIENLAVRLQALEWHDPAADMDDEIPF